MSFETRAAAAVNLVAITAAPADPTRVQSVGYGVPARHQTFLQKVNPLVEHLNQVFQLYYLHHSRLPSLSFPVIF